MGFPFFMIDHFVWVNKEKLTKKFSDLSFIVIMEISTMEAIAVEFLHAEKPLYRYCLRFDSIVHLCFEKKVKVKANKPAFLGAGCSLYF